MHVDASPSCRCQSAWYKRKVVISDVFSLFFRSSGTKKVSVNSICCYLLYVSSSLKATAVHASSHPELEALRILVRQGKDTRAEKFIVSTVYKPPSTGVDFWDYLSAQLDSQPVPKSKRIILGDFNTNAIPPHSPQLKYLNRANSVQSTVCTISSQYQHGYHRTRAWTWFYWKLGFAMSSPQSLPWTTLVTITS